MFMSVMLKRNALAKSSVEPTIEDAMHLAVEISIIWTNTTTKIKRLASGPNQRNIVVDDDLQTSVESYLFVIIYTSGSFYGTTCQ